MSKGMEIKQEERYSVKKNNKKQKKDKLIPSKEIDMLKFKQKIAYEMANIPIITLSNCIAQKDISNNDVIEIYSEKYKKYISEDFNTMCIVFINRLISESKTLPLSIKNFEDVHKTLLKIVKELMMNEYEITLLSLLLDKLSWSYQNVPFEDNIFYMGLTIKENSMKNESDFLFNYFSFVNKKCMEHYPQWKKDYYEKITFNCDFGEVYSRFSLLKQPYNIYCKTNYIDYNSVVDKILRMSLPYNESNKEEDDISITEKKNIKKPINAPIIQNNTIVNINKINNSSNAIIKINRQNNKKNIETIHDNTHKQSNNLLNKKRILPRIEIENQHKKIKDGDNVRNVFNNLLPQGVETNLNTLPTPYFGYNMFPQQNSQYFNYPQSQNLTHPVQDYINPLNRASVQTIDSNIFQDEDNNLNQLIYQSNAKLFGAPFGNMYSNDLDPFNVRGSSMMSQKFEQYTNQNIDDGLKAMPQPSNCSFNLFDDINVTNNFGGSTNVTGYQNVIEPSSNESIQKPEEHKKNLLGMYKQLMNQKEKEE